jgi:4-oxalomesaconate tautomerase
VSTRSFLPVRVHTSIGVLGALTAAAGVLAPGSVGHGLAALPEDGAPFRIEHPTGHFDVDVALGTAAAADGDAAGAGTAAGGLAVVRSAALRTARKIFDGRVFPRPRL